MPFPTYYLKRFPIGVNPVIYTTYIVTMVYTHTHTSTDCVGLLGVKVRDNCRREERRLSGQTIIIDQGQEVLRKNKERRDS